MKLLLTSFEPFGGDRRNSSLEIIEMIPSSIEGIEIIKKTLPVVYDRNIFKNLLLEHQPDVLLLCGQAKGRKNVSLEQMGINLMMSKTKDNDGNSHYGEPIYVNGIDGLFSTIPVFDIAKKLEEKNLPIEISLSAGGFICNLGLYTSLYQAKKNNLDTRVGFIHFPILDDFVDAIDYPSISKEKAVNILLEIIQYFK